MKPALILLVVLLAGGVVAWLLERLQPPRQVPNDQATQEPQASDTAQTTPQQGCADASCALRSVCPSEQLLAGQCSNDATAYYEDEELDNYAGRGADSYTPDELEQWRDVLYTLRPDDLIGWGQSIQRRGIVMPADIRDEFIQLVNEQREASRQ